jgi:hypothetical protein
MERREGNTYNIGKGIVILHMDLVASYILMIFNPVTCFSMAWASPFPC